MLPVQVTRPTPERFDEVLSVLQAADVAVYGATDWTETELRDEWDELDLEQDAWLVEVDGRLAGVAHLVTRVGGRFIADGYVHPELRGRGVGNQVLGLIEERVLELEPDWPESERIVLESAHLVGDSTAVTLHEARGYAFARRFFRMVIDVTVRPPEPVWPSGVETRPFDVEQDARRLHAAHEESFASEWGFVSRPFEEWRKRVLDEPSLRSRHSSSSPGRTTSSPVCRSGCRRPWATGAGSATSVSESPGGDAASGSRSCTSRSVVFTKRARRRWRSASTPRIRRSAAPLRTCGDASPLEGRRLAQGAAGRCLSSPFAHPSSTMRMRSRR